MRKVLTAAFCKAAGPAKGKRTEYVDMRCVGLNFRITETGAKSWAFRFRDPVSKNLSRLTIGKYPDVQLSDARVKATAMREQVAGGGNPIETRQKERVESPQRAFKVLADRYMREHARRHKRQQSADGDDLNLRVHILPKWAKRDYRKITRGDVIELIEGIVAAGKHTAANRVHALISKIFSFAVDADLRDSNPAARLRKRGVENTGKRVLDDNEIRLFWRNGVLPPVSRQVGLALRLSLLTAGRANEIAGVRLDNLIKLDNPKSAAWKVPDELAKNKRDFLIPLSPLAVETIKSAMELLPVEAEYLFQSPRKDDSPIDRHSLTVAMTRFAEALKGSGLGEKTWTADPPTPHDLRRTVETRMSSLGVPKEDRDACLNHKRRDVGSVHYDMYEREKEKRIAFNKLSNALAGIVGLKTTKTARASRSAKGAKR